MRHQDLETDAHHELRKIMRSVDKKVQLQVQDGPTPQDPLLGCIGQSQFNGRYGQRQG